MGRKSTVIDAPAITVILCDRTPYAGPYCRCGQRAVTACGFAFYGKKTGTQCDKPLCARCGHATELPDRYYCEGHANMMRDRAGETAEAVARG